MTKVLSAEEAVRAIMKFSGQYGLRGITIKTTLASRCQSLGELTLHPESGDAFPVTLESVRFPNLAVRSSAQMMRINFYVQYEHTEKVED